MATNAIGITIKFPIFLKSLFKQLFIKHILYCPGFEKLPDAKKVDL